MHFKFDQVILISVSVFFNLFITELFFTFYVRCHFKACVIMAHYNYLTLVDLLQLFSLCQDCCLPFSSSERQVAFFFKISLFLTRSVHGTIRHLLQNDISIASSFIFISMAIAQHSLLHQRIIITQQFSTLFLVSNVVLTF